jgi:hypothetical protein
MKVFPMNGNAHLRCRSLTAGLYRILIRRLNYTERMDRQDKFIQPQSLREDRLWALKASSMCSCTSQGVWDDRLL